MDVEYLREIIINDFNKQINHVDCIYKYNNMIINFNRNQITILWKTFLLSRKEALLLYVLVENRKIKVSNEKLMNEVWHYADDVRTLETHIKTLRNKLKEYRSLIITIWAYGYMFIDNETN